MNTDTTNNEFTFTEDEITTAAVNDPRYSVKNMLVNQLKHVNNMKLLLETLDADTSPLQLRMIGDIFGDEYNTFRMCCPKAWKAFMDVFNKRTMEYLEREKQKKAAKAKLPWYKRIFAW